ncbi:MAG TPA: TIGR02710 family CRISPR-associated CARF protein [Thermoclostridium sp.]
MNDIKRKLDELSQYWKNMDRSNETQRKAAEEYYKKELMPILIQYFLQVNNHEEECEALVLTLGQSYEPLVFSILTLKPKKVFILCTDESLHLLDDVIEFTKLKPSQYVSSKVASENPLELYQEIKKIYEQWGRPKNIYVDFTGGTKSMSAGCAMAGVAIKAKLVYISGKLISSLKKPEPGSERLLIIEDPYTVFGDLEREQAIALFNSMDYVSAFRVFEELDQRTNTKEYGALKCLSKAYDSWDSLDINKAIENLSECIKIIAVVEKLNKNFILIKHKDKLQKQLEVLKVLQEIHRTNNSKDHKSNVFDKIGYLIANLYQNALRREKQEKYEMASLLLYRILESIEQKRLWNYGIDTANADYSNLPIEEDLLINKIDYISAKVYGSNRQGQLEKKIGLMSGFITLAALEDDIVKANKKGKEIEPLKTLYGKVIARNNSIFAHGYEFINNKKYNDFKEVVVEYIDKLCELEKINKEELFDACEFITL